MEERVQTVPDSVYADLFGTPATGTLNPSTTGNKVKFGMEETEQDMFGNDILKITNEKTQAEIEAEAAVAAAMSEEEKAAADKVLTDKAAEEAAAGVQKTEADILTGAKPKPVTVAPLTDLTGYFQDRLKAGKFVVINEEDENGNLTPFIPKTAEDFDEVIELQVNHRLDKAKKDLDTNWYKTKSPAWQAVGKYAEMVDDPSELIPFLQGVRTIQSVSAYNENEIEGAENIVRVRLEQNGDPEEVINNQIESLKTANKLIPTAQKMKPIIIQQEQTALAQRVQQEKAEQDKYINMVTSIRDKAIKAIEQPFGKEKLKQDEKAIIYDLIAEPSEETSGYGIYTAIDNLYEKADFATLREIALLLGKKDAYLKYLGTTVAEKTAASLEKKLRVAGERGGASGNDFHEEQVAVTRNQYKTGRFGRDQT